MDKSVWEDAATAAEEPKPPHEGAFDELDAEVDSRIQLGAEGSGRYRRSAILGQGGGGSAAAVAGIPAAPSWHGRARADADSGPIRLTDEILAPEAAEQAPPAETAAMSSGSDATKGDAALHGTSDASVRTSSEALEVDVVLPPLLASADSEAPEANATTSERLEIEVTTASGVTLPTTTADGDASQADDAMQGQASFVIPSLLASGHAPPQAPAAEDAGEASTATPSADVASFAIPTLVTRVMDAPPEASTGDEPVGDAGRDVDAAAAAEPDPAGAAAGMPDTTAATQDTPDEGAAAAGDASAASSGPRRLARTQRAVSRASGFIEVRDDAEQGPPPSPAADAGFADDAAAADADEHGGFHQAAPEDRSPRSWGEETGQTASEEPDADVEELDAEDAEIEEADPDEDDPHAAAHDDPHAPEVALAAPVVAAVVADAIPAPPPPPERGRRRPWHEEIFTEGHARLEASRDDELVEREVAFVEAQLGLASGARILDVGTGVGHFAIGLGKRGYAVTGVDASLAVLLEASNRNEDEGNVASFLHGDMRRLPDDESYDGVLCLGQTFGYFDDADNQLALEQMRLRLSVGGRLLLQVRSRDHMVARLPCRSWWQGPRCLVLDEGSFDPFTSRVRVHRTVIFEDGRQHEERSDVRVYAPHELVRMLGTAGMEVVRMFGSRLTPDHYFPSVSPEIWILARRTS